MKSYGKISKKKFHTINVIVDKGILLPASTCMAKQQIGYHIMWILFCVLHKKQKF